MKHSVILLLICTVLLVLLANASGQTPDTLWTKIYGGTWSEMCRSIQQTSDSGYIFAGHTCTKLTPGDVLLIKTDENGNTDWLKTYGGSNWDYGYTVQQTSDGGYIIVGETNPLGPVRADVYLIKTDANGDTTWTKTFGGSDRDMGESVRQTIAGGYIIAGATRSFGAGSSYVYLMNTDESGDSLWAKIYGGALNDWATSIQVISDGYIVTGTTKSFGTGNYDVWLLKTDIYGDTIWTKTYGGTNGETGNSVQSTFDGGYIITGKKRVQGPRSDDDVYLIKTDSSGDSIWAKTYGGPNYDYGFSVQQCSDSGYIIAGITNLSSEDAPPYNAYIIKTDANGDALWTKIYGGSEDDRAFSVQQTYDDGYVIVGKTQSFGVSDSNDVWLIRLTPDSLLTDDANSLAYNGDRHLVRKPNTTILHLVYTMEDHIIYTRSTNGGTSWDDLENLGGGESPAIWLDHDGNPCVTWTHADTLCYSRKTSSWTRTNYALGTAKPSHPCITVTPSAAAIPDSIHIVFRYLVSFFSYNAIREFTFSITNPQSYRTRNLDVSSGPGMVTLDFPAIAIDYLDTLHATWMHGDTIHYATRGETQSGWNVSGWQFQQNGVNSVHPFAETYGDSVFVVWQNESDDEVYRASRYLTESFSWWNLSQTSETPSLYPVNASGLVTTFVDKSSEFNAYDIFWTCTGQTLHNLSNTSSIKSIFPHASLRTTVFGTYLYTIWQEGNSSPYEIEFEKVTILGLKSNPISEIAYFTSIAGFQTPSLHLAERDSFISNWRVPVDVGYEMVSYQFPLEPDYGYILKAIAYHEKEAKWKMKVLIDGEKVSEIEYEAHKPETLECSISPEFYSDSIIDVSFECDDGDFAAIGPVYIYRFENEGGKDRGGSQMIQLTHNHSIRATTVSLSPNPFRKSVDIKYMTIEKSRISLRIYDVSGRLIKQIDQLSNSSINKITWNGDDDAGQDVAQGIYFLRLENLDTKESFSKKILRLR